MSSQSTRPLKKARRAKQGNLLTRPLAESSADMFFFLYDDDLAELMFKFASIKCLCKLDILCKRSQRTTPSRWAERTMSRLGLAGGKRDWRHYHVLLGGPTFFRLQDDGDFGFGDMLAGSPDVTSNGNIVVGVSDEVEHNCWDRKFPGETQAIALRDAFSLNFVKLLSSPINNWKVAICGRVGSEIIVTSNFQQIAAQRGQDVQLPNVTGEMSGNTHGIPMLGCETHLLALAGNRLLLFAVGTSDKSTHPPPKYSCSRQLRPCGRFTFGVCLERQPNSICLCVSSFKSDTNMEIRCGTKQSYSYLHSWCSRWIVYSIRSNFRRLCCGILPTEENPYLGSEDRDKDAHPLRCERGRTARACGDNLPSLYENLRWVLFGLSLSSWTRPLYLEHANWGAHEEIP